tara:strand:+ start:135 stop:341 length:207 start_codon:yes stop_codon:yes gene_type:complete
MSEIKLKKGESVDRALKRLKKKLLKEGVLQEARERQRFEKPTRKRYKKNRKAKHIQKLKSKQEQEYWS